VSASTSGLVVPDLLALRVAQGPDDTVMNVNDASTITYCRSTTFLMTSFESWITSSRSSAFSSRSLSIFKSLRALSFPCSRSRT